MRGSGPRSAVSASSRPSGAMSKSSAFGSHGGSARPVPASASRQRPVATSHTMHVRLAAIGEPMVPETELRALGDVRLDLGVLALLLSFRLLRVGPEIGPHPADERNPPAVGKPLDRGTAGGKRGQPARLAAVGRDQIDLRLLVVLALRGERDRVAGGRPSRIAVLVASGEPARLRSGLPMAAGRKQPQFRAAVVLRHVEARHRRAGRAPSGDSVGAAMRFIAHNASTVSGGLRRVPSATRRVPGAGDSRHGRILVGTMWRCDSTVRAPPGAPLRPAYFHEH